MNIVRQTRVALALVAAALAARLGAQTVSWDPPGGSLPVGEVSQLTLVFEDCSPDGDPAPPKVDGLRIEYQGQSSNLSLINGSFSRSVSLSYGVLLAKAQSVTIPEFRVKTNKGELAVPQVRFAAAGATVGSSGVSLTDAASAVLAPSADSVWAGEVFDLKYTIDAAATYRPNWGQGVLEWDASPLVAEDWSQPEPFLTGGARARKGLTYHTRALALSAGHIELKPTSQLIGLSVGDFGFGFFQQPQYQQFSVSDQPVSIDVRPLPPEPEGFTGAVGQFQISSKIVPTEVKVGEPITWTVELSGTGNWPEIRGLPPREVPASFQAIQPKPKRTQPAAKLFDGSLSEDIVLVPAASGTYTLPPLLFRYFDPKSGTYRTITAPGAVVTADPAAPATGVLVTPAPGAPSVGMGPSTEARAPEQPTGGLGDPVPPAPPAPAPLRLRAAAACAALPFGAFILFWLFLAYQRARRTDPLRTKREARARLASTIEAMKSAPAPDREPLLLSWQRDTAVLWGIPDAAPAGTRLPDPAWAGLWAEADRVLYGPKTVLAADWAARAEAALSAKSLKAFQPAGLFLPRNLIPLLAAAALFPAFQARAADPGASYRRGDFAEAQKAWASDVATNPLDWSARHNLSLALAQQDRWAEAAAQASAAFVQAPGEPATRRQLAATGDKAGFVPDPLDGLIQAGPIEGLARLESPGGWQRAGIASAWAVAAALCLLVARPYGAYRRRWPLAAAWVLFAAGVAGIAASVVGYRAYGIAADTRAVVIWQAGSLRSVPTEADVSQKTTVLPAGSIAVANKSFLGWMRLSFPNGETGWVLRSEAVYLWQAPPD
ncbi:MAG TPA: BatD family protein [Opitutaceae bacterium]